MKTIANFINESSSKPKIEWDNNAGAFGEYNGASLTCVPINVNYGRELKDNEMCLCILYVGEENRKQGLGSTLVKELLNKANEHKYNICVCADPVNNDKMSKDNLIEFYKKLGFEEDSTCDDEQFLIYKYKQ